MEAGSITLEHSGQHVAPSLVLYVGIMSWATGNTVSSDTKNNSHLVL